MTKHSPGPWSVVDPSDDSDNDYTYIVNDRGKVIARVIDDDDGLGAHGRPRANVNLIAAAPEMLELLREIVTEGYLAELIAHKTVGGLRCQEEQRCFAHAQAMLARIDG